MLLDLLHTLNHFVTPLPEEYSDFKALIAEVFPNLIDTKLMAANPPFREEIPDSTLGSLKTRLGKRNEHRDGFFKETYFSFNFFLFLILPS